METVNDVLWCDRQVFRSGEDYYVRLQDEDLTGVSPGSPVPPLLHRGVFPPVIGLCGAIGAGKSTVARMLETAKAGSYRRVSLADALKASVLRTLATLGVARKHLYGTQAEKAEPIPGMGGASGREILVQVGTHGYRAAFADVWVKLLLGRRLPGSRYVIDDVRFANEINAIRAAEGAIWRVEVSLEEIRPTTDPAEQEWWSAGYDHKLSTARGDLAGLWAHVLQGLGLPFVPLEAPGVSHGLEAPGVSTGLDGGYGL